MRRFERIIDFITWLAPCILKLFTFLFDSFRLRNNCALRLLIGAFIGRFIFLDSNGKLSGFPLALSQLHIAAIETFSFGHLALDEWRTAHLVTSDAADAFLFAFSASLVDVVGDLLGLRSRSSEA